MNRLIVAAVVTLAMGSVRADWLSDAGGIAGFNRCFSCEVAYADGAGLTDKPVLVRISPERVQGFDYADLQSDGRDLVFTDANGNVLPHEIDTWNPEGESLVWVKIPSLAAGTAFYAFYGNADIQTFPDDATFKHEVWSDYAGVWHMGEVFEPSDAADSKVAYDSTEHGLHAEAKDTSSGQEKIAQMVPYVDGAIGVARQNQESNSKPGAYLSVPNYDRQGLADTFTISGWMRANEIGSGLYPRPISRKTAHNAGDGWEMQVNKGSKTQLQIRGASSTAATVTYSSSFTSGWNHYAWVFNGKTVDAYQNGKPVSQITMGAAATDNGQPLSFGSNSIGAEESWNGQFDEMRLQDGLLTAEAIAADYAMVNDAAFLTCGEVADNDKTRITFVDAPALVGESCIQFASEVVGGEGVITAEYTDVASGAVIVDAEVEVNDGRCVSTPDLGVDGKFFTVRFKGVSAGGSVSYSRSYTFYSGAVNVAKVQDANEAGLVAGAFEVTIPTAVETDFVFEYSVSGTAAAGEVYRPLSGTVTIPAGDTSVSIDVVPMLDIFTHEDKSVVVTLKSGAFVSGAMSAELTVFDDPTAIKDPTVRFVKTDGSDDNDGLALATAFKTIAKAVAVLGANGGRVFIAEGTYAETSSVYCVKSGTTETNKTACIVLSAPISLIGMADSNDKVIISRSGSPVRRIVYLDHPQASVSGVTLRGGGKFSGDGATVMITSNGGSVRDCIIEKGQADGYGNCGGNVYMDAGLVSRCVIRNGISPTKSDMYGGGVAANGGVIENSLLYGNTCNNGASADLRGTAKMVNCTVTGHNTSGSVAGVRAAATARVINCAIFGNTCTGDTTEPQHQHVWCGTASSFLSCAGEVAPNESCFVAAEASFASPADGDYRITGGSVCVDNGMSYDEVEFICGTLSQTDLAGGPREDRIVDIGCYEYEHGQVSAGFSSESPRASLPDAEITFEASVSDAIGVCTFSWDFDGDGLTDLTTGDSAVTYGYTRAGTYSVTLTVTDESGATSVVTQENLVFIGAELIYVDADSANPVFPYDTRATAASSIHQALEAACASSEIVVLDGEYTISKQVTIADGLYLHSLSQDPSKCVIRSTSGRNLDLMHGDAVVSGFTFEHGRIDQNKGAAILIGPLGGTVRNCVIRDAIVSNYSGDGVINMANGRLSRCIIEECWKNPAGDGSNEPKSSQILTMSGNATADNCLIRNCGHTDVSHLVYVAGNSVLENCTIVDGLVPAGSYAINVSSSTAKVRNCVVANVTSEGVVEEEPVTIVKPWGGTAAAFDHCAFDAPCEGGIACVEGTRQSFFKNPDDGDYRPQPGGPLTNTGNDLLISGADIDLAGEKRIIGRHVDIGCFEGRDLGMMLIFR